jgi:cytochrome c oxidase cbb3-type subunit 1
MWREYGADGYLVYSWAEVIDAMLPFYLLRAVGGLLYLAGFLFMIWNIYQTVQGRVRAEKPMSDAAFDPQADRPLPALAAARPFRRPAPKTVPANEPDAPLIAAE